MEKNAVKLILILFIIGFFVKTAFATEEQIKINFYEFVDQKIIYDPFKYGYVESLPESENVSNYSVKGYIEIKNMNTNYSMSDLWIVIGNISNIVNFTRNTSTRYSVMFGPGDDVVESFNITYNSSNYNDSFFENNGYDYVVIHIPELQPNETVRWEYYVNTSAVNYTPLNIKTNYSNTKIVTGKDLGIEQKIVNNFDYVKSWQDACIYDINISLHTTNGSWTSGSGDTFYYEFIFTRDDERNWSDKVHWEFYNYTNRTWYLYVNDSSYCLPLSNILNISYFIHIPENLPSSNYYIFETETLKYRLNSLVSGANVLNVIAGSSSGLINITKRILKDEAALQNLEGYNITWNVTAGFSVPTNITYNITKVTLWVAKRNNDASFLNESNIDYDTVTNSIKLNYIMMWNKVCWYNSSGSLVCNSTHPNVLNESNAIINASKSWRMIKAWLFNYTDPTFGSPIVFGRVFFTILNDNLYNISYSNYSENKGQIRVFYRTFSHNDTYNLQIYIIVDYFLQILKNITKIPSNNTNKYLITITVHNNGASPTPKGLSIIAYDFVPKGFNITTNLTDYDNASIYLQSSQYNVTYFNLSVNGTYEGTVLKFILDPSDPNGPVFLDGADDVNWTNENATFRVKYELEGKDDYEFREVYLTGLDPMLIEGAGESEKGVLTESIKVHKQSKEMIFLAIMIGLLGILVIQFIHGFKSRRF